MPLIGCQMNSLSIALVREGIDKPQKSNLNKQKGSVSPAITAESDICWSITRFTSCACIMGQEALVEFKWPSGAILYLNLFAQWPPQKANMFFRKKRPKKTKTVSSDCDATKHTTLLHNTASSSTSRDMDGHFASLEPAAGDNQQWVKQILFLPGTELEGRWGGESSGSRTERGLELTMLSIYTCRAEHQSLEDIWQGNNAFDTWALIHHHQPMHLGIKRK